MNEYIKTSPPKACGIATFPPGAALKERTLKSYELIWILEGVASIAYDGATAEAPEHTVLLLRPGFPHRIHWDPWRPSRHAYIQFDILELPGEMPPPEEWPLLRAPDEGDILLAQRPQHLFHQLRGGIDVYTGLFIRIFLHRSSSSVLHLGRKPVIYGEAPKTKQVNLWPYSISLLIAAVQSFTRFFCAFCAVNLTEKQ